MLLAGFTGWLGYVAAGKRWRQVERRSVYSEYLVAADEVLRLLRAFEKQWVADPESFPTTLYDELMEKNLQLDTKAQQVRLLAPLKVWNAAVAVPGGVEGLMTEVVYDEDLDRLKTREPPPSFEWFQSRREDHLWGPDQNDLDEFVNLARADLGAQSRFWRVRGDSLSYRRAIPGWIRYHVGPQIPLIGRWIAARNHRRYEALVRRSERDMARIREQRRQMAAQDEIAGADSNRTAPDSDHGDASGNRTTAG